MLVIIFPMLVVGSPASLARPGVDERDWSGADLATAPGEPPLLSPLETSA